MPHDDASADWHEPKRTEQVALRLSTSELKQLDLICMTHEVTRSRALRVLITKEAERLAADAKGKK